MRIERRFLGLVAGPAAVALLALMVISTPSPAGAERLAQAAPQSTAEASQSGEPKGSSATDAKTQKKDSTPKKAFRPSERITADTAVAFPVDI